MKPKVGYEVWIMDFKQTESSVMEELSDYKAPFKRKEDARDWLKDQLFDDEKGLIAKVTIEYIETYEVTEE